MEMHGMVNRVNRQSIFKYSWVIEKSTLERNPSGVRCPTFSFVIGNNKLEWQLELEVIPADDDELYKERMVNVHLLSCCGVNTFKCKIDLSLYDIMGDDSDYFGHGKQTHVFKPGDKIEIKCGSYRALRKYVHPPTCSDITKFKVDCEITVEESNIEFESRECDVCEDLKTMLNKQDSCDVTIMAEGHEIKAHKAILAARSAVFAAMFQHHTKESESDEVQIVDIRFEVVEEMLLYIYTGRVKCKDSANDLLIAADKYCLQGLKLECEKQISSSLSVENCVQALIFADMHSSSHLKARATDFIILNINKLLDTSEWKDIEELNPRLLAHIFRQQQQQLKKPAS